MFIFIFQTSAAAQNIYDDVNVTRIMTQLDGKVQGYVEELKSDISKQRKAISELQFRKTEIMDKYECETLLQQNKVRTQEASGSDIIALSIRGTEMFARRDTLTVVEGSRLEVLFSGRWDEELARDSVGRVFMDVDPDTFKKILEYLYILKISPTEESQGIDSSTIPGPPLYPSIESNIDCFYRYMEFFGLKERRGRDKDPYPVMYSKSAKIDQMMKGLDETKKLLAENECFLKFFLRDGFTKPKGSSTSSSPLPIDSLSDDDSGSFVDLATGGVNTPSIDDMTTDDDRVLFTASGVKGSEDLSILNLLVGGEIIVTKRSTLCLDPNSKLAQDFASDEWLCDHQVTTEEGKQCILVEQPLSAFRKLLHHIQNQSIPLHGEGGLWLSLKLDYAKVDDRNIFVRMFNYYFPEGSNMFHIIDMPYYNRRNNQQCPPGPTLYAPSASWQNSAPFQSPNVASFYSPNYSYDPWYTNSCNSNPYGVASGYQYTTPGMHGPIYEYSFPNSPATSRIPGILSMDTIILRNRPDFLKLQKWLNSANCKSPTLKLLYRASVDGWDASDFHRTCDYKGATLTLIKTTRGYIFGGYTDKSWTSSNESVSSDNAFVFHLSCHEGSPAQKYNVRKDAIKGVNYNTYAMKNTSSSGPIFGCTSMDNGEMYDLHIASNANVNKSKCFGPGNPASVYNWNKCSMWCLNGFTKSFLISDWEVFQV